MVVRAREYDRVRADLQAARREIKYMEEKSGFLTPTSMKVKLATVYIFMVLAFFMMRSRDIMEILYMLKMGSVSAYLSMLDVFVFYVPLFFVSIVTRIVVTLGVSLVGPLEGFVFMLCALGTYMMYAYLIACSVVWSIEEMRGYGS